MENNGEYLVVIESTSKVFQGLEGKSTVGDEKNSDRQVPQSTTSTNSDSMATGLNITTSSISPFCLYTQIESYHLVDHWATNSSHCIACEFVHLHNHKSSAVH